MHCTCGQRNWSVVSTRKVAGAIERVRECQSCGSRFLTEELVRTGKRLKKPEADQLRSLIDYGEVQATITTAILIDGRESRFEPKPATTPTTARPGSQAKIEILRQRVAMGEHLWHPADNATPPEPSVRVAAYVAGIRELSPMVEVA